MYPVVCMHDDMFCHNEFYATRHKRINILCIFYEKILEITRTLSISRTTLAETNETSQLASYPPPVAYCSACFQVSIFSERNGLNVD